MTGLLANAETVEKDGVTYVLKFYNHTAAVDRVSSRDLNVEKLVIPTTISFEDEEFTVDEVSEKGLMLGRNTSCKSVVLPNTVKKIGARAFTSSSNLKEVVLPEGLEIINSGTFSLCESLESIVIPESVKEIHNNAFKGSKALASVNIPKGISVVVKVAHILVAVHILDIDAAVVGRRE